MPKPFFLNIGGELLDLSTPRVMGILNITSDSFYDGGRYLNPDKAVKQAGRMLEEGATIIDVGGYSSRPGADHISEEEELKRVIPAIKAIKSSYSEARISIDTFRSEVARAAVQEGAALINDISSGQADSQMLTVAAHLGVPYIGMHMRGTPKTMTGLTEYEHVTRDLVHYFSDLKARAILEGITDLIIDPGFGFAKTPEQNFQLLRELDHFAWLDLPVLVGVSRKSFIYKTLGRTAEEALNGTTVIHTLALLKGAHILRVHDVREAQDCIRLLNVYNDDLARQVQP